MKNKSKLFRLFTLLLAVAMVVSAVPASIYAALGDLEPGVTNVQGNAFSSTGAPVSLPIKIYDYLNDGMLFDYAEASMEGQYKGGYAGGVSSPYTNGLIGTDYTGANKSSTYSNEVVCGDPFQLYATKNLMNSSAYGSWDNWSLYTKFNGQQVSYSQVGAVDNVAPQYINLRHSAVAGRGFAWMSNFARDDRQYYAKKDVRYAVIVYRTNDAYMGTDAANGATDVSHVLSWYWTISYDTYSTDYTTFGGSINITSNDMCQSNSGNDVAIPKSTDWTYAVVDMRMGNIKTGWEVAGSITGIGFGFPLVKEGEEMDISHIYYFEREDEAAAFGLQATQFNNDPGIDLSKEYYGGRSAPVVDLGLDFTNDRDLNGTGKTGNGSSSVQTYWKGSGMTYNRYTHGELRYGQVTNADRDVPDVGIFYNFGDDEGRDYPLWKVRYCVIVYHTGSKLGNNAKFQLGLNRYDINLADNNLTKEYQLETTGSTWTYIVVDMLTGYNATANHADDAGINWIGIRWPGFTSSTSQYFNFSHIAFFDNSADATAFGVAAAAFDNNPGTYVSGGRGWNMGNNRAYGLLRGSNGGAFAEKSTTTQEIWSNGSDGSDGSDNQANAYYTENIGYHAHKTTDSANKIYFVNMNKIAPTVYDTSELQFDGYNLLSEIYNDSLATMGMLEASLSPNGTPVYREKTVAYMAQLLADTLAIPEVNKREYFVDTISTTAFSDFVNDYYNYNYVKGTPDGTKYGYTITNKTDGTTAISYTIPEGQNYTVVARDLAQALRDSIAQDPNRDPGYTYLYKCKYALGTYAETLTKADAGKLTGSFKAVEANIDTCYDAAYYILNNLFVGNSYNTVKSDYNYLLLQPATVTSLDGNTADAYVFDAGFTNGNGIDAESGVQYDGGNKTITNFVTGDNSLGKTMYVYSGVSSLTTFHPFLPITDTNTEDGMTMSPYFQEPGASGTDAAGQYYAERNFNYVLSANGEFTYREDDNLFFEFEGDDDVYLFVNGQLVMDIGAAHSISSVRVNINDYVHAARAKIADGTASPRDRALALEDGGSYSFDFFYMERHGYGANMRIVTNMHVSDPAMKTEKTAYQDGTQINYGGIVNGAQDIEYAFAVTNTGTNTLFDLSFEDYDIGLSLTSGGGFQKSGNNLHNKNGQPLQVTDLEVYVEGYSDWYEATMDGTEPTQKMDPIKVTFANDDALKAFLASFESTGTSDVHGAGLWPYAKVTIRGIYYRLTDQQIADKKFLNGLAIGANTQPDGRGTILRGEANMLVMLPGELMYYQWAGHPLAVTNKKLMDDIKAAAADTALASMTSITEVKVTTSTGAAVSTTTSSNVHYHTADKDGWYDQNQLYIQYKTPGTYVFYLKVKYNTANASGVMSSVIPVLANVTFVQDEVFVLDYGLKVDLTEQSALTKSDYLSVHGRDTSWSCLGITAGEVAYIANGNYIELTRDEDGVIDSGSGQFKQTDATITYTPSRFMDSVDHIYVAYNVYESDVNGGKGPSVVGTKNLDINNEVQMIKEVSVLPANVVYYEDDFTGIVYNPDNTSSNVFTPVGGGSSSLSQQVDQDQIYGQDKQYQNSSSMSGDSLKKILIKDKEVCASFTFKGTGLELISRTNAYDSASILMTIKDSNGNAVKVIPVITQFDNINNGNKDEIHQVPVIRVKDLPYDTYTVQIQGVPAKDWSHPNGDGTYPLKEVYLYIDGIRVFQPMDAANGNYNAAENGALFQEIRDLILEGAVSAAYNNGSTVSFSQGTVTWTENLLGTDPEFIGITSSADQYLIMGPNNEVYLDGTNDKPALFFRVRKDAASSVAAFHIGVRAIDRMSYNGEEFGELNAALQYGIQNGDSLAWMDLETVTSGTEQYYSVDLSKCPVDASGNILVAIRVNSGMASFSSLKYRGLELVSVGGAPATLKLVNGTLYEKIEEPDGTYTLLAVDFADYPEFGLYSAMMNAETLVVEPEEEPVMPDFRAIIEQIKAEFLKMLTERLSSLFSFIG